MAADIGNRNGLIDHYIQAKTWICASPYAREIEWQASIQLYEVTEQHFLREYAWVVLNSGFREAVVRRYFNFISLCFCDWESANEIESNGQACIDCVFPIFRNRRKLEAIVRAARLINQCGFEKFKARIQEQGVLALHLLPYLGRVTKWHLAKNLGMDVAKPDRHLMRLADRFQYSDVHRMCRDIHLHFGDRIAVADIVLWRFEEQRGSRSKKQRCAGMN